MNKEIIFLDTTAIDSLNGEIWNRYAAYYNIENQNHEPYIFNCIRKPLEFLGFSCSVKNLDDIDLTKTFFLNLVPHRDFYSDDTTDIFESIPEKIIEQINFGKCFLIINNENEYDTVSFFNRCHTNFKKSLYIEPSKIILLSAGALAQEAYKKFCSYKNIDKKSQVKIIYSPHMNVLFNDGDIKHFASVVEPEIKTKKFTMFNREFRMHRPAFVALLDHFDLLEHGHVSLGINNTKIKEVENNEGFQNYLTKTLFNFNVPPNVAPALTSGIKKIADKIPMCLDKTEFETNYAQYYFTPVELMLDSYFHITSCTHYFEDIEASPGWHEKEWKPVLVKQPFIIFGRPGMLQLMRQYGFLTFDRWFNEDYDLISNDWHRMLAIIDEVRRLVSLSDDDWKKIITEMQPTLEYNYQVLLHKKYDLFFHNSDLKTLINLL